MQDGGVEIVAPIYPRPNDARIEIAKGHFCDIAEYIAPGMQAMMSYLIRAVINRGPTVAEAMWAIYELVTEDVVAVNVGGGNGKGIAPVSEVWPVAGLDFAKGTLHIDQPGTMGWGFLRVEIDHSRIAAAKVLLHSPNLPAAAPSRAIGRPKKNQPRITINARMLHEMSRNPDSENWGQREWAEHLQCVPSAISKTAAWKAIMENRESQKNSRKARTPRRYEE